MIYYFPVRLGGTNGADQAAADVLSCMRDMNWPITILCREKKVSVERQGAAKVKDITWIRPPRFADFPKYINERFFKDLVKWLFYNIRDVHLRRRFRRYLRAHKPALSVFNDILPSYGLAQTLRKTGKVVYVIHDSPSSMSFFLELFGVVKTERQIGLFAQKVAAACDALIFVSPKGRDEWRAYRPLRTKKAYVIPNCCREGEVERLLLQEKTAVREKLGLARDRFVIACVGGLIPRKGQDLLVDALPHLVDKIQEVELCLVGPPGHGPAQAWAASLQERVMQHDLEAHAKFFGLREDAMDFIYAADVLVLPSRAETQGIVVLEAMALKVPVVGADVGGIPELIQDGENGILFPVDDVSGLVDAILRLYRDDTLRQELVDRASQRYWRHFSQKVQRERYREVLNELLEDYRG